MEPFIDEETKVAEKIDDFSTVVPGTRPRVPHSPGPDLISL